MALTSAFAWNSLGRRYNSADGRHAITSRYCVAPPDRSMTSYGDFRFPQQLSTRRLCHRPVMSYVVSPSVTSSLMADREAWRHQRGKSLLSAKRDVTLISSLSDDRWAWRHLRRQWRHHYSSASVMSSLLILSVIIMLSSECHCICWPLSVTSSASPSVTSSSLCRRSRRSKSGNCGVVAPCRPVALVKPSWITMFQTQSFDETLSRTSTFCESATVTSTSSPSSSLGRRLRINVCGLYFETFVSQLDRHPSTLLGDHRQRLRFYDAPRDELFFDRHRPTFEAY